MQKIILQHGLQRHTLSKKQTNKKKNPVIYWENHRTVLHLKKNKKKFHWSYPRKKFAAGTMDIRSNQSTKEKEGSPAFLLHSAAYSNPTPIFDSW